MQFNFEKAIDQFVSLFGFRVEYMVKDLYGWYKPWRLDRNKKVYKVYQWSALNQFFRDFLRKHSYSATITGDPTIRVFYVDYTKKYWETFQEFPAPILVSPATLPIGKQTQSPEVEPAPISIH